MVVAIGGESGVAKIKSLTSDLPVGEATTATVVSPLGQPWWVVQIVVTLMNEDHLMCISSDYMSTNR
jgi:hypothetical protein